MLHILTLTLLKAHAGLRRTMTSHKHHRNIGLEQMNDDDVTEQGFNNSTFILHCIAYIYININIYPLIGSDTYKYIPLNGV